MSEHQKLPMRVELRCVWCGCIKADGGAWACWNNRGGPHVYRPVETEDRAPDGR